MVSELNDFLRSLPQELLTDITITLGKNFVEQIRTLTEGINNRWQQKNLYDQLSILSDSRRKNNAGYVELDDMDWLAYWFEVSKNISGKEMQNLWVTILNGELDSQGSFSKRSLNIFATISQEEGMLFKYLCSFIWDIEGKNVPLIYCDVLSDDFYRVRKINRDNLDRLSDTGLILFMEDMASIRKLPHRESQIYYYRRKLIIPQGYEMDLGSVKLTKTGNELASIIKAEYIDGFYEFVSQKNNCTDIYQKLS